MLSVGSENGMSYSETSGSLPSNPSGSGILLPSVRDALRSSVLSIIIAEGDQLGRHRFCVQNPERAGADQASDGLEGRSSK